MDVSLVVAMSVDGKIAPVSRERAHFGRADARRLERLCAAADALVFGAATLRAYGTTRTILASALLDARRAAGKPPQPLSVVVTNSGAIDLELPFFTRQEVPRVVATSYLGASRTERYKGLAEVWICGQEEVGIPDLMARLRAAGVERVALLGGGELNAAFLAADAVDQIELTVAPQLFGGQAAPTPVDGPGLDPPRRLLLSQVDQDEGCLFLTYRVLRDPPA
ncbi:MAG: dihydrofolate reductase family protein [Armatimonadetes bacterium]|nr:dihydrofolate reductase family protein [Armatimonadota bacterium]